MTNQTYHLIPEPAGDWKEGDRRMFSYFGDPRYRARPVPAQAGQLWRVEWDEDIYKVTDGAEVIGMALSAIKAHRLCDLLNRPVPAQACACEGLMELVQQWRRQSDPGFADTNISQRALKECANELEQALAQSCPCQQGPSKLPNAVGTSPCCPNVDSVKWNPYNGVVQCHACGTIYDARPCQQSGEQPENLSGGSERAERNAKPDSNPDEGDATTRTLARERSGSSAPPAQNLPASASEAQAGLQSILDKCWEAVGDEYAGTPIWYTIADFKESHNTIAALRLELEERDQMLELIRRRELEFITEWRAEDELARFLKQPDYGELLIWLGERIESLRAQLKSQPNP